MIRRRKTQPPPAALSPSPVKYQSTFTRYMAALDRKADLRASENERLSRRVQITIAVSTIVLTLATIVSLFAKR